MHTVPTHLPETSPCTRGRAQRKWGEEGKLKGIILLLLVFTATLRAQDRPNILLIIADDLGVDPLNGYHEANLKAVTPTLDSLRAAGLTFTNAAATPVCSPTRAAIMSGQYGVKNGVLGVPGNLDDTEQTLFKQLAAATDDAYANALIGKWHLTQPLRADDPAAYGVKEYDGFLRGGVNDYFNWSRVQSGVATPETTYVTTALTDAALDWIGAQTQPWFLWLAHAAPHTPYHVPPAGMFSVSNPTNNQRRYIAMIEALDFEVGRMLRALTPEVAENTLVIFVGDNGTPNNVMQDYPNGHGKGSLYQGGVRVPFILSGNGVTRTGERENALVHVTDLHATILEAAGARVQGGVFNSLSFYHLLGDETEARPTRDYNYYEVRNNMNADRSGWAIRGERYKLISFDGGTREFYDLITDSLETNDLLLAGLSPEAQTTLSDLEAEAAVIRSGWSCRDHIRNGTETGIDCGTEACGACTTSTSGSVTRPFPSLYPNPTTGHLTIDAPGGHIHRVNIYGSAGRLMRTTTTTNGEQTRVSTNGLKAGLYFTEIILESGATHVVRTVKQ